MKKNAQNELIEVSDGMYKKKKRKNKAVVFGGILLVGFILYTVFSGYIVKALLGGGQERLAVECYNTQFYRGFIDNNVFDKHIDKIYYQYLEDDSDNKKVLSEKQKFNKVQSKLKIIGSIANKKISQKAKYVSDEVKINHVGWNSLSVAEKKFEKEQFLDAIIELKKVDKKFVQYDAVSDLLADSKTELFASVECPNSDDEYKSAIEIMNKCYKCLNEQEYNERSQSLEQEYAEYQAVERDIAKADEFIQQQKYIEAVSCLKEISKKYPNEKHLISALEDADNILLFSTVEKANELSKKEQYDKALDELDAAREIYPCEDFDSVYRDIESKSSKLLWLKNKALDFKDSVVNFFNKDIEEVKKDGGIPYIEKSGKKILLGDYSKEDVNVLSCVGDGALALAGLDVAQNVRDLTYDVQHIGEEDDWLVWLAVDTVAVIPVIGTIKYLKYLKQTGKATDVADNIGAAAKAADKVSDTAKTIDKVGDVTKEGSKIFDKLKETKLGNLIAEKRASKHFEIEKTINQNLVGRYCEGTKIKYRERKLIYKDGRRIRGVFPDFSKASIFECKLPDNLLKATDDEQFKECIRQLQEQIKRNPSLKKKLGKDRLEQIKNGRIKGYTWHHNEKEGVMQLVDSDIHSKVRHTGGKKLWGGGTEAR